MSLIDPHLLSDALRLLTALALGAMIGFERQWRQRLAGLRTNTLVALGAATFVIFAGEFSDASPTRVAAQVVTGIGFLGAGVISKEGANVRGLNTAATLWCSGAVGLLAGAGFWRQGLLAAALIILVNLLMPMLIKLINRQPIESAEIETFYRVVLVCRADEEAKYRAQLLQEFSSHGLRFNALDSENIEGSDRVEVTAQVVAERARELALEHIVGQLSLEPDVTSAKWRRVDTVV